MDWLSFVTLYCQFSPTESLSSISFLTKTELSDVIYIPSPDSPNKLIPTSPKKESLSKTLKGFWKGHVKDSNNILIPEGLFYSKTFCVGSYVNFENDILCNSDNHVKWNTIIFNITNNEKEQNEIRITSGSYYWEFEIIENSSGYIGFGIANSQCNTNNYLGSDRYGWSFQCTNEIWHNGIRSNYCTDNNIKNGDIIGIEFNLTEGTLRYFINRNSCGIAFKNLNSDAIITSLGILPAISLLSEKDKVKLIGFANGKIKLYYEPGYNINYYDGFYYQGLRHGYGIIKINKHSKLEGYFCYNNQVGLHIKTSDDNKVCYYVIERNKIVKPATISDIDYYNNLLPKYPKEYDENNLISIYNSLTMNGSFYLTTKPQSISLSYSHKGSNIIVNENTLTVTSLTNSKGMIFASEGYTTGIHYWECEIHCTFVDYSIYIGISPLIPKYMLNNDWYGIGLTNNRLLRVY